MYVDPALIEYAVRARRRDARPDVGAGSTTSRPTCSYGASPRAAINLILAAKALAFVRGRTYALPQDVRDLALDVMRHRLVLSYEALADGVYRRRSARPDRCSPSRSRGSAPRPRPSARPCRRAPTTPEQILQRLDWQVIRRLDGLLQGDYRTLFYGAGVDFAEPARVPARRRRAPHRLERHRAHGRRRTCASTSTTAS